MTDTPDKDTPALYIHLRSDGGIYIISNSGDSGFATERLLRRELARVQRVGGTVAYSREHPDQDPPPWVQHIFDIILSYSVTLGLVSSPPPGLATDESVLAPRALCAAAYTGDVAHVDELLRRGLPIDQPDEDGQTPLMYAANAGHLDVVRRLLVSSADANARDKLGNTPLMFAAQHGHSAIVSALLAAGGDARVAASNGYTAIELAKQNDRRDVVHLLARYL